MAQIFEETITIKLSRLLKNDNNAESVITEELLASLVAVAEELVGDRVVVELE